VWVTRSVHSVFVYLLTVESLGQQLHYPPHRTMSKRVARSPSQRLPARLRGSGASLGDIHIEDGTGRQPTTH
jgi:hypothetical protein